MLRWWLRNAGVGAGLATCVALASCSTSESSEEDAGDTSANHGDASSASASDSGDGSTIARVTADGGPCIANCHQGDPCSSDGECASNTCTNKVCVEPSCTDGTKDGTETASDCGGTCAACPDGDACALGGDCTSGVCDPTKKTCSAPSDSDGVQNGSETAVDCGQSGSGEKDQAPPCAAGLACGVSSDCVDKDCGTNHLCLAASCSDAILNGTETAVDCGGSCNPCGDGLACAVDGDCSSKSCDATGTKLCLAPTSSDHIANGNETDVDCGQSGSGEATMAPACADGLRCGNGADCVDLVCGGNGTCSAPSCSDNQKNGFETAVDCGGGPASGCAACLDTQACKIGSDCTSLSCDPTNLVCLAPTDHDDIKNGTETDIDCGSGGGGTGAEPTNAPPCALGKSCVSYGDCASSGCNYLGVCIAEPSCAPHLGGDTCGAGETGTAAANHESCCASIPLPGSTTRLDKYEITAGRMREFVNRTGGDINKFWQGFKAAKGSSATALAQIRSVDEQYLPTGLLSPMIPSFIYVYQDGYDANGHPIEKTATNYYLGLGIYSHLGSTVIYADSPSDYQGCYVGAPNSTAYGHPTYYWDDATMSDEFGGGPRYFTQDQLDEKSLNCVTEEMLAAFCAWDGGHLATQAEILAAWTTTTYPWGASPDYYDTISTGSPGRTHPTYYDPDGVLQNPQNSWTVNMPVNDGIGLSPVLLAPTYNMTNWNAFYPALPTGLRYYWPAFTENDWGEADEAFEIAAPGRFVNDKAPNPASKPPIAALDGWFDLAGNVMETTATVTGSADANHSNLNTFSWVGGSFEGHDPTNRGGYNEPMLTKYGKAGGRCSR